MLLGGCSHSYVGSLQSLGVFGRVQEVVIVGTLLPFVAALQVKGDQACPASAALAPFQQGRDGTPENGDGAAGVH